MSYFTSSSTPRILALVSSLLLLPGCGELSDDVRQALPEARRAGDQILTHLAQRNFDEALLMVDPVSSKTVTREAMERVALLIPRNLVLAETPSTYRVNKTANAAIEITDVQAVVDYEFSCDDRTCADRFLLTRKAGAFYLNSIQVILVSPPKG